MKILHINQSDIVGGAGIAGYRLHQGLLEKKVDSKLLAGIIRTYDKRVDYATPENLPFFEKILLRITSRIGLNHIHRLSSSKISSHPWYQAADIINLHNLHTGYFSYLTIPKLTAQKPAVFTLHDIWGLTGHCALNFNYKCERWRKGCGKCPDLNVVPAIKRDASALEWHLKNWVYKHSNLTIVAPSQWLAQQAQQSMLNRFAIHHIPHGIDLQAYYPIDSLLARKAINIPTDKKVLLFSADNLRNAGKGRDLLQKALNSIPESLKSEIILLTFGSGGEALEDDINIKTYSLGYISSNRLKSLAYSAADLFIFPTRADIFGLVLQESMACGTPMVSFRVGGVTDLVRPGITGYLAQPEDHQDFCQGIVQLLNDNELRKKMAENCRSIALQEYALELQTQRYIKLYESLISKST